MAATGFLALLDDVTTILDDVATMSKVAAQKTVGIAGDDLAVNAEGLVGLEPARELPIVGKVALGSFVNKLVLIPLALVLPASVIGPLLMIGGAFLCYEGVHKVLHKKGKEDEEHHKELVAAVKTSADAVKQVEAKKVKQAIITDVVLSAEIVAIALSAVQDQPFATRATVLFVVGIGMTIAIYGLVAAIVKLDDIGLHLMERGAPSALAPRVGRFIVEKTPLLLKGISVIGTVAMFLVGGGIILHGLPGLEPAVHHLVEAVTSAPWLRKLLDLVITVLVGVVVGGVAVVVVGAIAKLVKRARGQAA